MLKRIKTWFNHKKTRPVFVIGTGRSGTHWLGFSLGDHPEVFATIEEQPMFGLSTQIALNPSLKDSLFPKLVSSYKDQLAHTSRQLYLDKSHPNIWSAEALKAAFPTALFIGIERNPYATVASMLKHKGVLSWHHRWKEFPIPNHFLGITTEIEEEYDNIPLEKQCAMRWLAHHNEMNRLKNVLENDLLVISYESFSHNTEKEIFQLKQFLQLNTPIPVPEVKTESLGKWKTQLSKEQLYNIEEIVGISSDQFK